MNENEGRNAPNANHFRVHLEFLQAIRCCFDTVLEDF